MIVYTIILIAAGAVIAALAGLIYTLIAENSHFRRTADIAFTGKEAEIDKLIQEINRLQQENAALNARNTALVEAMEARPTQPKRTVRKNVIAGEQP